jgi:lysophosphatidic acid acyltransferase/lysophosphatidylinositol acyltransferase
MFVTTTPEVFESLGKRNELFLMNHTYEIDAPATWMFSDHFNILGRVKCFVKKELMFVPVLGWSWFFAEFFFLERDWAKDKRVMEDRFASLASWPEPFWVSFFFFRSYMKREGNRPKLWEDMFHRKRILQVRKLISVKVWAL